MRYCECGRELEYRCRMCSECGYVNRQISLDMARHSYINSDHGKKVTDDYFKSEKYKDANRKRMITDERKAYKRKLYKESRA